MTEAGGRATADGSQLRERPSTKPLHLFNSEDAKQKVLELNDQEDRDHSHDRQKRTYGRTPDGTGTHRLALASSSSSATHALFVDIRY